MKDNQNFKWDDITLKALETKLRSIPKPDVPVTLKEKLLAAIPKKKGKTFSPVRPGFGFWSYGATAAGIDMNEGFSNNFPNDLNVPLIEDINYVNDNIQLRNIETRSALSLW